MAVPSTQDAHPTTPFAGGAAQTNQVEIEHEAREQTLDDPDVSHLDEIEELDQDPGDPWPYNRLGQLNTEFVWYMQTSYKELV